MPILFVGQNRLEMQNCVRPAKASGIQNAHSAKASRMQSGRFEFRLEKSRSFVLSELPRFLNVGQFRLGMCRGSWISRAQFQRGRPKLRVFLYLGSSLRECTQGESRKDSRNLLAESLRFGPELRLGEALDDIQF